MGILTFMTNSRICWVARCIVIHRRAMTSVISVAKRRIPLLYRECKSIKRQIVIWSTPYSCVGLSGIAEEKTLTRDIQHLCCKAKTSKISYVSLQNKGLIRYINQVVYCNWLSTLYNTEAWFIILEGGGGDNWTQVKHTVCTKGTPGNKWGITLHFWAPRAFLLRIRHNVYQFVESKSHPPKNIKVKWVFK